MSASELEHFAVLARLDADERLALADALEELEVDAGTLLFDEGDPAEGLVLIEAGRVRVSSERTPRTVTLGPGASLGGLSLAAHGLREACAETTSRSRLLVLRRDAYERLVREEPRAACRLIEGVLADTVDLLRSGLDDWMGGSVDPGDLSD